MKKYILMVVLHTDDNELDYTFQYFDDLVGIYQSVCRGIVYKDEDIEDILDEIDERLNDNGVDYYVFINGQSSPSTYVKIGNSNWDDFSNFCFKKSESIQILKFIDYK